MQAVVESQDRLWADEVFKTRLGTTSIIGQIKTSPEAFIVKETLLEEPVGVGEHVYLQLTKTGANTAWVAEQLATYAQVRPLDVGYAGRKDRHAVTQQWFSIYQPGMADLNWQALEAEGVSIDSVTRHTRKLRPGELEANSFEIIVRHNSLDESQVQELERRLSSIQADGFPNYFGYQRFGRDLHNLDRADEMLRFKRRMGGDRGMLMSAARGWLYNIGLSRYLEGSGDEDEAGPLFGKSRDPQQGEDSLDPIYQQWVAGLRRHGAKVGERQRIVCPTNLVWDIKAEHTRLSFSLPTGTFATSLLQELFLVEDASS